MDDIVDVVWNAVDVVWHDFCFIAKEGTRWHSILTPSSALCWLFRTVPLMTTYFTLLLPMLACVVLFEWRAHGQAETENKRRCESALSSLYRLPLEVYHSESRLCSLTARELRALLENDESWQSLRRGSLA